MQEVPFKIVKNEPIAPQVFDLLLEGPTQAIEKPGQFVQLALPGFYLRRPLSVCDCREGRLRLIYKIFGKGTLALSQQKAGVLSLLTGLGNGFDVPAPASPVLVGGGVGIPPLYFLARRLVETGQKPQIFLGFNRPEERFLTEDFQALGLPVVEAVWTGGPGVFHGSVVEALDQARQEEALINPYLYACGPRAMLKALAAWMDQAQVDGQFSLEERMACGFGACMGCTIQTQNGPRRVCKNGPVFSAKEVLWS